MARCITRSTTLGMPRPLTPIGLRDTHPTHRLRLIGPIKQVLADGGPVRTSEGRKVFQGHPVSAGRSFAGFHALPCPTPIRGCRAYTMRRSRRRETLSLFQALVAGAADLVSLSRRDRLGVSYGVKVPVGQGLATHPYRALGPWRSQADKPGEQDGLSVGRVSCRP
jgi:hypothetical protein